MMSIIVGAVVMFAAGALWFMPLFGKTWSRLMNFSPEMMEKAKSQAMNSKMVMMFVINIVSAFVLGYLASQFALVSAYQFMVTVFVVWLGFTLPSLLNTYLWEGKSMKLVAINAGGSLFAFLLGSIAVYMLQ
jgi:hypothetical protein